MIHAHSKLADALIVGIALACMVATPTEARRGGSFGSRGSRTYMAPRQTTMTSGQTAPVQRSMTQPPSNAAAPTGSQWRSQNTAPAYPQAQPASRFGGFGGGMIGGLVAGGLIGSMMGHGGSWGMGGGGIGGGFLISIIQLLVLGGLIWFVMGFFRRRSASNSGNVHLQNVSQLDNGQSVDGQSGTDYMAPNPPTEITITDSDKTAFEHLLNDVQDAFGHEDYGRLRELTTPEIMSYLSEELSQNATSGKRNDVTAIRLIDAEVSEAWQEDNAEYATIAMRYESIDVMRDRTSSAIISGDPKTPTVANEVWTFVRQISGSWKLSAIQE
jgi:predicted lipid-binding transport protein (Tim44 family)